MSTYQQEQKRVDFVIQEIDKRITVLQQQTGGLRSEVVDIRKTFWEDVTANFEDTSEAAETAASIKQQAELLSERERSHRQAYDLIKTLSRQKQSPYFGRIDFHESGEPSSEQIYLGIASLIDQDGMHFLVYDWRAPVSSLYYDYPPGSAQYETPSGTIQGELELKRQYIIRDGILVSMFDTGVTIGDELLKEVLGKQSDSQMRSIVATIQREQNQIIRNESSKLLIVQGAAGSGKTSAALQRVAYLLYRYRGRLKAEQIVLFSPNPMFNHYISTVLPELGEENMQQVTYQQYLEHRLNSEYQVEDPYTLLEYEHTGMKEPHYNVRMAGIAYKSSLEFKKQMKVYADSLGQSGLQFHDLELRGKTIVSAERMKEQFYTFDSSLSIPIRMDLLKEWLLKELKSLARVEMKQSWVDEEVDLLDQEEYAWAHQELMRRGGYTADSFNDYERERRLLAQMVVGEAFKPLRKLVKQLLFVDMHATYLQLFAQSERLQQERLPAIWPEIVSDTLNRLRRGEMPYEDATPYLDLEGMLQGVQINGDIRHIFIDEGQDYSPYQFAYLKQIFPRAKMTVLGDINQAIFTHTDSGDGLSALRSLFSIEETESYLLSRSYRSTRPIVEFTRSFMPGGEAIEPFQREGAKPTLTIVQETAGLADRVAADVHVLCQAGYQSVAVITKTAEESREAYAQLSKRLDVRLIDTETVSYEQGSIVIPAYLAKGVEFDAVILYNASKDCYGRESDRKLFYTACTRAMHELHLYAAGDELTPFLAEAAAETYEVRREGETVT